MSVYLVGATKGGSGKSTVATNLAAYFAKEGHNVMLMDTDVQKTSTKWGERREDPGINLAPLPKIHHIHVSGNVYNAIRDMSKLYDVVVVDAGGHDSREMRSAMLAADQLIIPLQASQFDLETLTELDELITKALDQNPEMKIRGVVNNAPAGNTMTEVLEAKDLLSRFPLIQTMDTVICNRKHYRDVTLSGRGAVDGKNAIARAEIELLAQEVLK